MDYVYGKFSEKQLQVYSELMHSEVHKLLLYKDKNVTQKIFDSDKDFHNYFTNLLFRFGGLNELFHCPIQMVALMATLKAAFELVDSEKFDYYQYRRLILDAHAYITDMFAVESEE